MKLKLKNKYYQLLVLLLMGVLFLCIQEKKDIDLNKIENQIQIRMNLKTETSNTFDMYALTKAQETKINDVCVFFINKATGLVYSMEKGINISNNTKCFSTVLSIKTGVKGPFECFVLVNAEKFINRRLAKHLDFIGKNYEELRQIFSEVYNTKEFVASNRQNEMWGKSPVDFSATSSLYRVSIPLTCTWARVDIGVGGDGIFGSGLDATGKTPIPFKLENISIYQPNGYHSYFPSKAAIETMCFNVFTQNSAQGDAILPSLSSSKYGCHTYNKIPKEIVSDRFSTQRSIYLTDTDVKLSEMPIVGDAYHKKRCAIVVGGYYGEQNRKEITYYRIDFKTDKGICNIIRNYKYVVNITKVNGPGFKTPDEAYENTITAMETQIIDWDGSNQNIIFDGQTTLSINSKNATLPGSANSFSAIKIVAKDNKGVKMDCSEWKMKFSTQPEAAYSKENRILDNVHEPNFAIEKTNQGIRIIAVNDQYVIKKSTIDLLVKKIHVRIEITQYPIDPSEMMLLVDNQCDNITKEVLPSSLTRSFFVQTGDTRFKWFTEQTGSNKLGFLTEMGYNNGYVTAVLPCWNFTDKPISYKFITQHEYPRVKNSPIEVILNQPPTPGGVSTKKINLKSVRYITTGMLSKQIFMKFPSYVKGITFDVHVYNAERFDADVELGNDLKLFIGEPPSDKSKMYNSLTNVNLYGGLYVNVDSKCNRSFKAKIVIKIRYNGKLVKSRDMECKVNYDYVLYPISEIVNVKVGDKILRIADRNCGVDVPKTGKAYAFTNSLARINREFKGDYYTYNESVTTIDPCASLIINGEAGWRLPTYEEMNSIVKKGSFKDQKINNKRYAWVEDENDASKHCYFSVAAHCNYPTFVAGFYRLKKGQFVFTNKTEASLTRDNDKLGFSVRCVK